MTATILVLALAVVPSQTDKQVTPARNAETPVGDFKVRAIGLLVHKDNVYRLSVHAPDEPKAISLLLQPTADNRAVRKKLADLGGKGKQVIVTGAIMWLPTGLQIKSDDDWVLGIVLSDEEQIRETFAPEASQINVEARGRLTWKDSRFRLIVRPQLKPAKELTLDLRLGDSKESKELVRKLDSFKTKEVLVESKLQWVPKGAKAESPDDYTLGFAEPIKVKPAESGKQPAQEKLTPEQAKEALLAMMRSKAGQELGWFKGDIPDEMAKMKIDDEQDGWFAWTAAFRFSPSKAIYTFVVRPKPGARASIFEYEGSFVSRDGMWSATPPKLVRTVLQSGE